MNNLYLVLPPINESDVIGGIFSETTLIENENTAEAPQIITNDFTKDEDDLIIHLYIKLGPRWKKRCEYFPNHTQNQIKSLFRKKLQNIIYA